jgi:predicted metal-dependent phosphoesterase TrpH
MGILDEKSPVQKDYGVDNYWYCNYNNSMIDKLKNLFAKKSTKKESLSEKEIATNNGEPYVKVLETNVDKDNPKYGYFELDWNKHFVENLKQHGFSGNTDEEIVDHWFSVLCNTIAEESTPMKPESQIVKEEKREDGKTEIS